MSVYLVRDAQGKITGTAPAGPQDVTTTPPGSRVTKERGEEEEMQVEVVFEPLEGQTIHEVELPAELARLDDGAELQKALAEYRLTSGEAKLVRRR
jgi:hypothetical protein